MNKLIIEYDPDKGITLPDNKYEKYVNDAIANREITPHVVIGSELLLTLFRCAVVKNKIKHSDLKFMFKGKIIDVDKYGTCREWPKGFDDIGINALEVLMGPG